MERLKVPQRRFNFEGIYIFTKIENFKHRLNYRLFKEPSEPSFCSFCYHFFYYQVIWLNRYLAKIVLSYSCQMKRLANHHARICAYDILYYLVNKYNGSESNTGTYFFQGTTVKIRSSCESLYYLDCNKRNPQLNGRLTRRNNYYTSIARCSCSVLFSNKFLGFKF